MPIITVTHTVRTYYEVPEGYTIEQLRCEMNERFEDADDAEDALRQAQKRALSRSYGGKTVHEVGQSCDFKISEGYDRS